MGEQASSVRTIRGARQPAVVQRPYLEAGIRLRAARHSVGLSQAALAGRLGVSVRTLHRMESGWFEITPACAGELAEAMGVSREALTTPRPTASEPDAGRILTRSGFVSLPVSGGRHVAYGPNEDGIHVLHFDGVAQPPREVSR